MHRTNRCAAGRCSLIAAALVVVPIAIGCASDTPSGGNASNGATNAAPEEFGLSLADLAARVDETERLIAGCMATAGFQYTALDFVSIKEAMDSDQTAPGVSSDDYVKQFGLGITTQLDPPIVMFGAGPVNATNLEGMLAPDRVAFVRALWGEATDWNHAHALEAEDFSQTGGCTREAAEQTYTVTELSGAYVNTADILLEQDPRMVAAIESWSECMRAEGLSYDNPNQVEDDLHERLDAIVQGQDPGTLTGPALDSLHELQGEELAIAEILTSCEEDVIEPVQAEIESEMYGAPQS
jgi:hypothetical protein